MKKALVLLIVVFCEMHSWSQDVPKVEIPVGFSLIAALIQGPVNRGRSFALRLDGLKEPGIVALSTQLVSECDSEVVLESGGSYRKDGIYYAVFYIPESVNPCLYKASRVEYLEADDCAECDSRIAEINAVVEVE